MLSLSTTVESLSALHRAGNPRLFSSWLLQCVVTGDCHVRQEDIGVAGVGRGTQGQDGEMALLARRLSWGCQSEGQPWRQLCVPELLSQPRFPLCPVPALLLQPLLPWAAPELLVAVSPCPPGH